MTLADASDSQAWANRLSVSMPGTMTNIVLGFRAVAFMRAERLMYSSRARSAASWSFC
ncbi:hypothetical protein D3C78_1935090 [compost metagenome]